MQGRENRGYKRIQELSSRSVFTSDDISATYGIGRRASNLWIQTMHRKGLIESANSTLGAGRKSYAVSAKGKAIARLIEAIERDYNDIAHQKGIDDAEVILRQTKVRTGPIRSLTPKPLIQPSLALNALN